MQVQTSLRFEAGAGNQASQSAAEGEINHLSGTLSREVQVLYTKLLLPREEALSYVAFEFGKTPRLDESDIAIVAHQVFRKIIKQTLTCRHNVSPQAFDEIATLWDNALASIKFLTRDAERAAMYPPLQKALEREIEDSSRLGTLEQLFKLVGSDERGAADPDRKLAFAVLNHFEGRAAFKSSESSLVLASIAERRPFEGEGAMLVNAFKRGKDVAISFIKQELAYEGAELNSEDRTAILYFAYKQLAKETIEKCSEFKQEDLVRCAKVWDTVVGAMRTFISYQPQIFISVSAPFHKAMQAVIADSPEALDILEAAWQRMPSKRSRELASDMIKFIRKVAQDHSVTHSRAA
ncbi:MAG: hypothetical protein DCC75_00200 [Proteobacteria bacterium]|nr:MAG: hypothetical protein DCC75_00200 [Pseudomonadota bacterium]